MVEKKEDHIILTKTYDFSLSIIALYKILINQNEFTLSKKNLR